MTVRKFYFIYFLLITQTLQLLIENNNKKRILEVLSEEKKVLISKKLIQCRTKICEKNLLIKTLQKLTKSNKRKSKKTKKKQRKLKESQKNNIHILIIMIFIFIMFNSNFNISLIISGFIVWSILLMILQKTTHQRKLISLKPNTLNFGEKNYMKIYNQEKPILFDYLKNNEDKKFKIFNSKKLGDFVIGYFKNVYQKEDRVLFKNVRHFSKLLFNNKKNIEKKISEYINE